MANENYCDDCKVYVANDLKHCPLCGKFVRKSEQDKPQKSGSSYPDYDFSYIYKEKHIRILEDLLLLAALICVATNIVFWTSPLWFPYAVSSIIAFYYVFLHPFKNDENYLKSISITVITIAIFLIFLDLYISVTAAPNFGWSISYVAPLVLCFGSILCGIIGLFSKKVDIHCIWGLFTLLIISVLFFIMKLIWFSKFATWPSFMYLATTVGMFVLILIFKFKKFKREMNKSFHI